MGEGLEVDEDGTARVKPEGEMVLIERITLSEALTEVVRTAEPDGTPYKFSAITIRATFPPSNRTGNLSIYFSFNWPAEIRSYMINPYNATQQKTGFSKCYLFNKRWRSGWWSCTGGDGEFANYYENPFAQEKYGVEDGYISKIKMLHTAGIETGTIFEVWGVRA